MKSTALTLLLAFAFLLNVNATIHPVPGTYATIQAAINASANGDTIAVSPGTYFENINFRGKNVLLTSLYYLASDTSYISSTIINGSTPVHPDTASCVIFNSGEDSTAILQGFTITGGTGTKWLDIHGAGLYREGGGIIIELCSPTVRHNVIKNNQATDLTGVTSCGGGGIRIGDGNPGIYSNVIAFNQGRYGAGIVLNYSGCKIKNNIIFSNTGGQQYYGGSGIWITNDHAGLSKIIENNTIVGNYSTVAAFTGGIAVWSATNVFIRNNIIRNNQPGPQIKNIASVFEVTYCDVDGGYTGSGNIDQDPNFESESYFLGNGSACIDAGDSSTFFNDLQDPANPGHPLFPSKGNLRNDMGAYGGPYAALFPAFGTVTGIQTINSQKEFSISPNPFSSETTLTSTIKFQNANLKIYDVSGKSVKEINGISGQQVKIKRENLPAGIYVIRLTEGNVTTNRKVIISD